jgi:hypothetical protein
MGLKLRVVSIWLLNRHRMLERDRSDVDRIMDEILGRLSKAR